MSHHVPVRATMRNAKRPPTAGPGEPLSHSPVVRRRSRWRRLAKAGASAPHDRFARNGALPAIRTRAVGGEPASDTNGRPTAAPLTIALRAAAWRTARPSWRRGEDPRAVGGASRPASLAGARSRHWQRAGTASGVSCDPLHGQDRHPPAFSFCPKATAPLRIAALSIALSLIVHSDTDKSSSNPRGPTE